MIVMMALLIGGTILGPLGMLFAVPAAGVLKVILTEMGLALGTTLENFVPANNPHEK